MLRKIKTQMEKIAEKLDNLVNVIGIVLGVFVVSITIMMVVEAAVRCF